MGAGKNNTTMTKIKYKDIAVLVVSENKENKVEIFKDYSVGPRINIKTGETISMVVTFYLNGKFTYDWTYIEDIKRKLNAFSFSIKVQRSQLVLMYDIATDDFDSTD